jgi:hypothetical protein
MLQRASKRLNMDVGHMRHAQHTPRAAPKSSNEPRTKSRREIGVFIVCLASGGMPWPNRAG